MESWFERQFGDAFNKKTISALADMYLRYGRLMNNRRPEHMSAAVYSITEGYEAERILREADEIEEICQNAEEICPEEYRDSFKELVSYKVHAGMNNIRMWIFSAYNHGFARLGLLQACTYADMVRECLKEDVRLKDDLHAAAGGKWFGFGKAEHIGFRNWNSEESTYPTVEYVIPAEKTDVMVGLVGESGYSCGGEWTGRRLSMSVYEKEDAHSAVSRFFIATRGTQRSEFSVSCSDEWISVDKPSGIVNMADPFLQVKVTIDKDRLEKKSEAYTAKGVIEVKTDCGKVMIDVSTLIYDESEKIFIEENGMVVMDAAHYDSLEEGKMGSFKVLEKLGRNEDAIKLFPVDRSIKDTSDAPVARYRFKLAEGGEYKIIFVMEAVNPFVHGEGIDIDYSVNDSGIKKLGVVSDTFDAGSSYEWNAGVLDHVRQPACTAVMEKGINCISFYGTRVENVLERVIVIRKDKELPGCYLGPRESIGL